MATCAKHFSVLSNLFQCLMNIAFREFCYLHTSSDWRSWKSVYFQAGIKSSNLIIANESNAASVFCLFDRSERGNIRGLDTQPVGTKYMVVDIGGVNLSLTDDKKNKYL